jgi:hypothetical protein
MEAYTWVTRQVGKRGAWEPYQLAALPFPPTIDDKITMQRWATPACQLGDTHKASFVLDFDAHAEWLRLEVCLEEVRRFLYAFAERWQVSTEHFYIAFSGRAGFHVTIPTTLLGDIASSHLTSAYKHWATAIKDGLGLITLDAPSRKPPEWWWERITATLGGLPLAVQDRDTFALSLRRAGIYSRRRMIRREGSQHPGSGQYKIPLLPHELALGVTAIHALAGQPRMLPARLAPAPHPGLAAHLRHLLAEIAAQEQQHRQEIAHAQFHDRRIDPALRDGVPNEPLLEATDTPLCIQRLLEHPAPAGASNLPLMTLAAYCRTRGILAEHATTLARRWLLLGVTNPDTAREREESARSVVKAAYDHRYRFARRFIAPLHLVSDDECAACPLRTPCYGDTR